MKEHRLEPSEACSFEVKLAKAWPVDVWQDVSVMIAVSGGPDSVALLLALRTLRQNTLRDSSVDVPGRFEVAHFNHRWRGEASDEDEQFVAELCNSLSVPLHIDRAGESTNATRSEVAARDERYAFLQRIAEQRGARYLVTAHTADDQAETIIHRILRGTGLRGVRGIQATRRLSEALTVVRPLLWSRRSDVNEYLKRKQQKYRTDSSNADPKYTRNRIRSELLPKLAEDYNPSVVEALLRLGTLAQETLTEMDSLIARKADECFVNDSASLSAACGSSETHTNDDASSTTFALNTKTLTRESDFLQREILIHLWRRQGWPEKAMTFEHWTRMIVAIQKGNQTSWPGDVQMLVQAETVVLIRRSKQ